MAGEKKFLVIGNLNAITYKQVFPLIKENKMWLGMQNGAKEFRKPSGEYQKLGNTCWFTNMDHGKRHEPLQLMTAADNLRFSKHKKIRENGYPEYDNYDAIEVPFVDATPSDCGSAMGVPISFIGKYCPEQFEIVGMSANGLVDRQYKLPHFKKHNEPFVNGNKTYQRILIKHKKGVENTYPKYDNYDAIEVPFVDAIPSDCGSEMGVPISFLYKYCPKQFEIIGIDRPLVYKTLGKVSRFILDGKEVYARIVIKHKKGVEDDRDN